MAYRVSISRWSEARQDWVWAYGYKGDGNITTVEAGHIAELEHKLSQKTFPKDKIRVGVWMWGGTTVYAI